MKPKIRKITIYTNHDQTTSAVVWREWHPQRFNRLTAATCQRLENLTYYGPEGIEVNARVSAGIPPVVYIRRQVER